jgi:hypothetical protein
MQVLTEKINTGEHNNHMRVNEHVHGEGSDGTVVTESTGEGSDGTVVTEITGEGSDGTVVTESTGEGSDGSRGINSRENIMKEQINCTWIDDSLSSKIRLLKLQEQSSSTCSVAITHCHC